MKIDFEQLAKECFKETVPKITSLFKAEFQSAATTHIKPFFLSKHEQQQIKDNPRLKRHYGITPHNTSDIGYVTKMVEDLVTEKILSDETRVYMEKYIQRNFETFLKEAMDKAMEHHAKKLAFKMVDTKIAK